MKREEKLNKILEVLKNTTSNTPMKFDEIQTQTNIEKEELKDLLIWLTKTEENIFFGDYDYHYGNPTWIKEKGKSFLANGGYVKQAEKERIESKLTQFNYDTRKWALILSAVAFIVSCMFSLYTCVNDTSNKTEMRLMKSDIQSIKDSILVYTQTKKGDSL